MTGENNHPNRSKQLPLTAEIASKVLSVVDAGLISGKGNPIPGRMCVEAAVCYAYGLPHSDEPPCVGSAVRRFKIRLNDSRWPTNADRTAGMRKLAIAQLGSNAIDQRAFAKIVVGETIKQILPITMRLAAAKNPKFADRIEIAAKVCEKNGSKESAQAARALMQEVRADAYAAADADADAAAAAAAYAAADADADADAAAAAYAAADAAADADAAAYAAAAADAAAYAAARLQVLNTCAKIGLDALIELKSPGCEFLYLCD